MSLDNTYPPQVTQPRQVMRWMDIHAQGGSLKRTRGYVVLPSFSQAHTWLGYSDIVLSFNFTASNNFSLRSGGSAYPSSPNYTLCISWIDDDYTVYRYVIWRADNDVIYGEIPDYAGQLIKKNFRFEIWSTSATPVVNAADLTFYTTVLGSQDYRYGSDFTLGAGDEVTDFWYDAQAIPDVTAQGLILSRFKATYGVVDGVSWTSTNNVDVLTSADVDTESVNDRGNTHTAVLCDNVLTGTAQGDNNYLYILFKYGEVAATDYAENLAVFDNSYNITYGKVASVPFIKVNGTTLANSDSLVEGRLYLLTCIAGVQAFLVDLTLQVATTITTIAVSVGTSTTLDVLGNLSPLRIVEIIPFYSIATATNFQNILKYFTYTYAGQFLLPLTMPTGATSELN